MKDVGITSLSNRQYCYIQNPVLEGKVQYGKRILIKGEIKFFLKPGEILENNKICDVIVLGEEEALLLKTIDKLVDDDGKEHCPGHVWIQAGPCDFIPKT